MTSHALPLGGIALSPWLPLDGAIGTELARRFGAAPQDVCGWHETHPDDLLAVYRDYLAAGAQALTTNTLTAGAAAAQGARLVESAVRIACRAAADRPVLVSLAPLGEPARIGALAACGIEAGAAGILLETATDVAALATAVRAVRSHLPTRHHPVLASVVCTDDGALAWDGTRPVDCAAALADAGADAVGVNCAAPPAAFRFAAELGLALPGEIPLLVRPSAGKPVASAVSWSYSWEPPMWAEPAFEAASLFGGRLLVGGCCGAGPAHIAALFVALRRLDPC